MLPYVGLERLRPTSEGRPVVEAARRVQSEATARLAVLIAAERELLPTRVNASCGRAVFMEFLKTGLHGRAIWWAVRPGVSRRVLVDTVMQLAWAGLRPQIAPTRPTRQRA